MSKSEIQRCNESNGSYYLIVHEDCASWLYLSLVNYGHDCDIILWTSGGRNNRMAAPEKHVKHAVWHSIIFITDTQMLQNLCTERGGSSQDYVILVGFG